jgi:hypothetical protein
MKDKTRLERFRTKANQKLHASIVDYCTPDGNLDHGRVRFVFSWAGITPTQNDSDLMAAMMQYAHLLNDFYANGGARMFPVSGGKRSPKRSPKKKPLKKKIAGGTTGASVGGSVAASNVQHTEAGASKA